MSGPTPTLSGLPQRKGDFDTLTQALDYAAKGETGLNFYAVNGALAACLPYNELRADALRLARRLIGSGLKRNDRLAIIADTTPDFVRLFFASQYAGLTPVPLPLPFAFGGREAYLAHVSRLAKAAKASALFAPESLAEWIRNLGPALGLRICGAAAELEGAPSSDAALPTLSPDDTAYLQFSSGSTRFPMGVAVRHSALMANAAATLTHGLQIRPNDRAVSWLPLYHDMGLVGFLLTPLAGQASIDLLATRDFARRPQVWLSLIAARRATISFSPSFGYDLCARRQRADAPELDLSSWRIAGIGGDMIRASILQDFADKFAASGFSASAFLPSYGMAEATLAISFAPLGRGIETDLVDLDILERRRRAAAPRPGAARTRQLVLCGGVLPGHELEVRASGGAVLQDRREGRIFVRGPSLMQGYDGQPNETETTLSKDGWLDTGDLGYWLDGSLVVTGRAKDLIIINGRNIWPQDVEWTVELAVPGVRSGNVAAFSIEESGREVLVVAVDPKGVRGPLSVGKLATDINEAVRVQHGLEGRVILVPPSGLPYTSSGKLSRVRARQRYLAGRLAAPAAPM